MSKFTNTEIKRVLLSLEDTKLSDVKKLNKTVLKEHKEKDIDWNSVVVKSDKVLLVMPYYGGDAESPFDENDEEKTAHMMTFNYVLKRSEKAKGITILDIVKGVIKHNNAMKEFTEDYPFSAEVSHLFIEGWKMTSNSTINMPVIFLLTGDHKNSNLKLFLFRRNKKVITCLFHSISSIEMAQSIEFNNAEIKSVLLSLTDTKLADVKKLNKDVRKEHKEKDIDWNSVVVKCDKVLLVIPYYGGDAESPFDEEDKEKTAHMMTFNYVLKRGKKADGITILDIVKGVIKHNNAMKEFTEEYPYSAEVSHCFIEGWKMTSNSTINIPVIYPSHWGS